MQATAAETRRGRKLSDAVDTELFGHFTAVRALTARLTEPLSAEDQQVQSMPDVSPTKWHLAHTSWFFETFLLSEQAGYQPFDASFAVLFNSYYNTVGEQHARARRGLLSRPSSARVQQYRAHVDAAVAEVVGKAPLSPRQRMIIELGLHHEQQHQELLITDIKHVLSCNPTFPVYAPEAHAGKTRTMVRAGGWHGYDGGLLDIGNHSGGFCFDNEMPRHRRYLPPFMLASRLVTAAEWQAFMADNGYRRAELWLSEGWDWLRREQVEAPLYWHADGDGWQVFTLHGLRAVRADEPVVHVSYYEADAYARWAKARLPREEELEVAARSQALDGHFVDSGALHPRPASTSAGRDVLAGETPSQLYGDCWEWTQSSYSPYPGYSPPDGALGEYNGKFMCNQQVLRGGSCATSRSHMRPTYRNFFPASARWQFSGVRLARDV